MRRNSRWLTRFRRAFARGNSFADDFDSYSESSRVPILPKDALGREGERLVFEFVLSLPNVEIVACNVENYYCELDLIFLDRGTRQIVFVEVKTRRRDSVLRPAFRAVDAKRRKKMVLAASRFVAERGYSGYSRRYDVAVVLWPRGTKPTIRYYRSAFGEQSALSGYRKTDFGKTRRLADGFSRRNGFEDY